jgi:hypothetical protein
MKRFCCSGLNGEGCPKQYSSDDKSNLKKHAKRCGHGPGSGGARVISQAKQNVKTLAERGRAAYHEALDGPFVSRHADKELYNISKTCFEQILAIEDEASGKNRKSSLVAEARAYLTVINGTEARFLARDGLGLYASFKGAPKTGDTAVVAKSKFEGALAIFQEGAIKQSSFDSKDNHKNHQWIEHNIAVIRHELGVVLHELGEIGAAVHFHHALLHYKKDCSIGASPMCAKETLHNKEKHKGCYTSNILCHLYGEPPSGEWISARRGKHKLAAHEGHAARCGRPAIDQCMACNPFDGCCFIGHDTDGKFGCALCGGESSKVLSVKDLCSLH